MNLEINCVCWLLQEGKKSNQKEIGNYSNCITVNQGYKQENVKYSNLMHSNRQSKHSN